MAQKIGFLFQGREVGEKEKTMIRNANSARSESARKSIFLLGKTLSRFASVFLGLSFVLVFSTNAFGLICTGNIRIQSYY